MTFFRLLFAILFAAFCAPANAETAVSLLADCASVSPGQSLRLGLRMKSAPRWHTYWKNPGDAGSAPEIEWEKIQNASFGDWRWPAPKLFRQGDISNFVYEGDTTILIPVKISGDAKPGEKITFAGKVSFLECDDSSCVPKEAQVSLTLSVSEKSAPANAEIFAAAEAALPRKTDVWQITASRAPGKIILRLKPAAPDAAALPEKSEKFLFFPLDAQVPAGAPAATRNEAGARVLVFDVKNALPESRAALAGVLTAETSFLKSDAGAKALEVNVARVNAAGASAGEDEPALPVVETPDTGALAKQPWTLARQTELLDAGKTVYVDFTARWCATCQVNKHVYANPEVAAAFRKSGIVFLVADWTKPNPEIAAELAKYGRAAVPFNVFLKKNAPPVIMPELLFADALLAGVVGKNPGEGDASIFDKIVSFVYGIFGDSLAGKSVLGFFGGIILNLMPCVFPVIGLKIMSFVGQAGENRKKVALHGVVFSVGVVTGFWILAGILAAVRAGGEQIGWGFQMQNPAFLTAMAVLMLVFGLNMAGVFEIGGSAVGIGGKLTSKRGRAGSFFSGMLATVIATPCAAPFLAPALGAALTMPVAESYAIFTAIALGLAAPYLALSFAPALLKFLPKPGEWMESLKQGLSFLLFGTVLFFLWVLAGQAEEGTRFDGGTLRDIFLGLAVIAFACWIYGRWTPAHRSLSARLAGGIVAGALLAGTCVYFVFLLR